jgi:hypothetical protein
LPRREESSEKKRSRARALSCWERPERQSAGLSVGGRAGGDVGTLQETPDGTGVLAPVAFWALFALVTVRPVTTAASSPCSVSLCIQVHFWGGSYRFASGLQISRAATFGLVGWHFVLMLHMASMIPWGARAVECAVFRRCNARGAAAHGQRSLTRRLKPVDSSMG